MIESPDDWMNHDIMEATNEDLSDSSQAPSSFNLTQEQDMEAVIQRHLEEATFDIPDGLESEMVHVESSVSSSGDIVYTVDTSMASSSIASDSLLLNRSGGYFVYTLDAPTSGLVRLSEDTLTYLNKDQYYSLCLEYIPFPHCGESSTPTEPPNSVYSIISVQFPQRERHTKEQIFKAWETWISQQPQNVGPPKAISVLSRVNREQVERTQSIAHNAVRFSWSPASGSVQVKMALHFLSTDFASQKGVKGVPLHIQIDTYDENNQQRDRAFAQIKTFSDKGAERKLREEEKRQQRQALPYQCQRVRSRTIFTHNLRPSTEPTIYPFKASVKEEPIDDHSFLSNYPLTSASTSTNETILMNSSSPIVLDSDDTIQHQQQQQQQIQKQQQQHLEQPTTVMLNQRPKPITCPTCGAFNGVPPVMPSFIYVRQENEEVYTALRLMQPNINCLIEAISAKFRVEVSNIRHIYKRSGLPAVIHVDSDYVAGLAGCFFLMKILVVDGYLPALLSLSNGFSTEGHSKILYDIILCELTDLPINNETNATVK